MTCEAYVISRIKEIEKNLETVENEIKKKEEKIRKLEEEIALLKAEKDDIISVIDPKITTDEEGYVNIEFTNSLYGWSREHKLKIEKFMKAIGLQTESVRTDCTGSKHYTITVEKDTKDDGV